MNAEEARIQSCCVFWLRNMYPQTRGCFFCVNNNASHVASGVKNKSMGVVAGVSDCLFIWGGITYCFEFKAPKGRQSDVQKEWESSVVNQGARYFIVRNLPDFQELIYDIIEK